MFTLTIIALCFLGWVILLTLTVVNSCKPVHLVPVEERDDFIGMDCD